ncbi:Cupin 2 conserved barrel domain protein [Tepidicaulis marinus]|uniref:Cupin 2 conserved barrel domain protein n=1 Tax=Tepidicaulis marinus TaxID=1333998 RepID=A0A081B6R9_9HYPH|nr:cupin domain-containing protein [Tepidicaulis marinus]GAK43737.1 Cupin 2 conserved barrel domain protein [Tepidicaulis marinus]
MTQKAPPLFNFLDVPRPQGPGETLEVLLARKGVRLERIVSLGHATPEGEWYDQRQDEWVMLAAGRAALLIEGEEKAREMKAGDCLFLPAHCRHRVTWTDPESPSVWLALHIMPEGDRA